MASLSGHLAWGFRNGRFLDDVERALGRPLTEAERKAFADDAHGGWWETSMMLMLRPELVDGQYRDLPPATYSLPARLRRNYPLRDGGQGYVGHPAMADLEFAKATTDVLVDASLELVNGLLDGHIKASGRRSPYTLMPFFRTNFWRVTAAGAAAVAVAALAVAVLAATSPRSRPHDVIDLEARDGVAWLHLDRPHALNALNRPLAAALAKALDEIAAPRGRARPHRVRARAARSARATTSPRWPRSPVTRQRRWPRARPR